MKIPKYCRLMAFALIIFGTCETTGLSLFSQGEPRVNWNEVLAAYDRFLAYPSPEKAGALARLLPKGTPESARIVDDEARALDHFVSSENFGILAIEAEFGNRGAIVVLLRLLNFADGLGAEYISAALGNVVRSKPKLFLEIMKENGGALAIKQLGPRIAFPQYAYNNHPGAHKYDLVKRHEAVASVTEPELAETREACLELLAEELKKLR